MKKIIALATTAVLFTSGLACAAELATGGISAEGVSIYGDITTGAAQAGTATLIGKLSKGVKLGVKYNSAEYALTTKHSSGNTQYGTAYDATAIYKQDVGATALTAPTESSNTAFATGWTAM